MKRNGANKHRLVCGVGTNDADYNVHEYEWVNGKAKLLWNCPIYKAWSSMLQRCYSKRYQERKATYLGCTVDPEWLIFSNFKAWADKQDYTGKQLDKDLLAPGNKNYSKETCVFLPREINSFLTDSGSSRGQWPIGVCLNLQYGKFMAMCSNPVTKKNEFLGRFYCPQLAHNAWRARKHEHSCRYAEQQTDLRIINALRNRYAAIDAAMQEAAR